MGHLVDMLSHNATYYNNKTKITEFKINKSYNSYILVCVTPKNDISIYYWDTQANKTYEPLKFDIYGSYLSENDINILTEASFYNKIHKFIGYRLMNDTTKLNRIKQACI